jgi:hypothetical protein
MTATLRPRGVAAVGGIRFGAAPFLARGALRAAAWMNRSDRTRSSGVQQSGVWIPKVTVRFDSRHQFPIAPAQVSRMISRLGPRAPKNHSSVVPDPFTTRGTGTPCGVPPCAIQATQSAEA